MKVKELIKQLEQYDPEARVYSDCWMGEGKDEILCSYFYNHSGDVILQNLTQFDVYEEIKEMLEYFYKEDYDETDAYQLMCDLGYTPDVVAEHYNKEQGNKMFLYCEEHGIDVGNKAKEYMKDKCLCEYCENGNCTIRFGIADDIVCTGTIKEIEECNYK